MAPQRPLVLIVDDDPDLLALEAQALAAKDYRTATAHDGEEALQLIEKEEPQLVLLDMRMPRMDGWAFARILRDRYGRRIPIVVVTAAEDSKLRADEIGADADLGKPFELERLYEVVADTLGTT
jgi:CheY-like chemotaxis protein